MRLPSSGLHLDNPAYPLLQGLISYIGQTTSDGNAGGTTIIDSGLDNEPSYDGLVVKILSGDAAGQARTAQYHPASSTITVGIAFTDNAGSAVQIVSGTRFCILTSMVGGGGPGPSPEESITYYGIVDSVPGANQFTIGALAGLGASKFIGANPYWAFVLRDAGGAGAAPQGELQPISAYTTATGNFTAAAFTAAIAAGDEVLIIHPALAAALISGILASGTLTTSSATVPADTGRTEANDYWNGSWLMTLTGAVRMQPRLIVDFANAGGVFTLDAEQPFTAAPGLVAYVILPPNSQLVPAADSANNQTPAHVIGNKTDTIPAMNAAPGNDSIERQVKAILERVGATPADPDDSLLTSVGQRDAAATADDLSDVTTTDLEAKIRRVLLRFSANAFSSDVQGAARTDIEAMVTAMATYFAALGAAWSVQVNGQAAKDNLEQTIEDILLPLGIDGANVFNPTIQGASRTDLDTALAQIATYFVAAGAAMALQVNGNAARTNLQQALNDYFAVVGVDGANVFSTTIQGAARTTIEAAFDGLAAYFVAAGAALSVTIDPGGSARTTLATLWNDLGQMLAGTSGITTWPAAAPPGDGVSFAEAIRQIYNDIVAINSGLQEQADTAINITAIAAGETNVFDLSVAATRYVIRSLRLKAADPGANTISVRLYELINDVSTVVTTFTIDTNNFGTYHSLVDMFGVPHLAGDNLKVTVQASAGGPYAVTGQYSHALAT